jgi:hypothetical protein
MRMRAIGWTLGLLVLATGEAWAQVAWDAPLLLPPRAEQGLGLYLINAAPGDVGIVGTWRSGRGPQSIGLRVGLAEDFRDDATLFGGVDVAGTLTRASADFPLDIDWVLGGGIGIGDDVLLTIPLGLTIGHTFVGDGVRFIPYVSPRVVVDAVFGDDNRFNRGDDKLELNFVADIGVDLRFQPGWGIRFGTTFGDVGNFRKREALAIGIIF